MPNVLCNHNIKKRTTFLSTSTICWDIHLGQKSILNNLYFNFVPSLNCRVIHALEIHCRCVYFFSRAEGSSRLFLFVVPLSVQFSTASSDKHDIRVEHFKTQRLDVPSMIQGLIAHHYLIFGDMLYIVPFLQQLQTYSRTPSQRGILINL